jgi:hypothetical protein
MDTAGFSDSYVTEKWRVIGATGAARFAAGKFQIEATKGYVGINTVPFAGSALLVNLVAPGDVGLTIVAPTGSSTTRFMQFEDQNHNVQGNA